MVVLELPRQLRFVYLGRMVTTLARKGGASVLDLHICTREAVRSLANIGVNACPKVSVLVLRLSPKSFVFDDFKLYLGRFT